MAITRAQIPEQIDIFNEGGEANVASSDDFSNLYQELFEKNQPNFQESYDKYYQRLAPALSAPAKMSIYDFAAELGKGLGSTPNIGGTSLYAGLSAGFSNISDKIKADKNRYEEQQKQIALKATELALSDEKQAEKFLQDIAIKKIDAANKDVDYIVLEYDEVINGKTVTTTVRKPDTVLGNQEVNEIYATKKNVREVKPATTQINLPGESPGDKAALGQIFKDQESFGEKAEASLATLDQVEQARILAKEIGPEGFGPLARSTLYLREFVDGIGYGSLLEDSNKIPSQKALNQLSMSFTMGIVSQTKGAISDREMKLFIQASPTLGSTYEGYLKQLELLERLAARDSDFYQEFIAKSIELEDSGLNYRKQQLELEKFASGWKRNNPLFTEEETKSLEDMVAGGDGGFVGAGLDKTFDRDAFESGINTLKKNQTLSQKVSMGIEGVPDGSSYVGSDQDGNDVYFTPNGEYVKVPK